MEDDPSLEPGALIGGRYRLERSLSDDSWLALDQAAADALTHLTLLGELTEERGEDLSKRWLQFQGVLHSQLPRFGDLINTGEALWLPRPWQEGETLQALLDAGETFSLEDVLVLLRQLLPCLLYTSDAADE